jgi:hypothetical protein
VKPRIPLAYAGLLIIALMAVVGFAAFSPGVSNATQDTATTIAGGAPSSVLSSEISARVASAALAVRVTEADTRVATTASQPTQDPDTDQPAEQDEPGLETTTTALETTTTTTSTTSTTTVEAADEPAPESEAATIQAAPTTTTKQRDTTPPSIRVTAPHDGDTVKDRVVTFSGTSEPGAKVASGPFAATMSNNGDWTIKLALAEGANGASFTATDAAGNSASTRIVVTYTAPSAPTTTRATPTTTKPQATTTTTKPKATTTTSGSSSSKWSPNWPADAGGSRNVENWRPTVAKYWPANRVDCVLGIIKRESNGDPRAYNSSSSAEGLMQHLSKYWVSRAKGAGFVDGNGLVATPYNGAANIAAGAYLGNYYDGALGQWWNPWKSSNGQFTATYGSCTSSNPG